LVVPIEDSGVIVVKVGAIGNIAVIIDIIMGIGVISVMAGMGNIKVMGMIMGIANKVSSV
jgi:hypothetical protein